MGERAHERVPTASQAAKLCHGQSRGPAAGAAIWVRLWSTRPFLVAPGARVNLGRVGYAAEPRFSLKNAKLRAQAVLAASSL
jgi:hypothetical protein